MNLLVITQAKHDSTSFYRAAGVFRNLRKQYPSLNVTIFDEHDIEMTWADIMQFDCIMFQRPFNAGLLGMIQMAKTLKIPVWVDYDDNLLDVPRVIPRMFDVYNKTSVKEIIAKCIALADVVTVSTTALKEAFAKLNKNVIVVRNAIDLHLLGDRSNNKREKLIGWRGSATHASDLLVFQKQIADGFKESQWDWYFIGYDNFFLSGDKYHYIPATDPFIYFHGLKQLNLRCLHVPLIDNYFNRCKSNIAAIEGTWAGAVCIVPKWQEWDIPGMLQYETLQDYYDALMSVVKGGVNIKAKNDLAWEYICDVLSLDNQNKRRVEILKNL